MIKAFFPARPQLAAARPPSAPRPRIPRRTRPGRWITGLRPYALSGRTYDVYLPAGRRRGTRSPVIMLLHGCRQTPAEFAESSRFTTVADRNGIVLVLPSQEGRHHPQRCWRWYEAAHQRRGSGEPALLAAVLGQVVAERERWRVDPRRVYVAGLSAGGAMALIMAATYPDLVAAAGVHSAPAYRSSAHGGTALAAMGGRTTVPPPDIPDAMAPMVVVQGSADTVVDVANGRRVATQWLAYAAHGGRPATRHRADRGRTSDGRRWTRTRWYAARGRRVLELWQIEGLGHAWSGGRRGSYSDPRGPRAATLMWGFLRTHRLDVAASGSRSAGA